MANTIDDAFDVRFDPPLSVEDTDVLLERILSNIGDCYVEYTGPLTKRLTSAANGRVEKIKTEHLSAGYGIFHRPTGAGLNMQFRQGDLADKAYGMHLVKSSADLSEDQKRLLGKIKAETEKYLAPLRKELATLT